jgi:hypothetical protein
MIDLSAILVRLRQVELSVRELSAGGSANPAGMQARLEDVGGHLAEIVADLQQYVHAEVVHHAEDPLTR